MEKKSKQLLELLMRRAAESEDGVALAVLKRDAAAKRLLPALAVLHESGRVVVRRGRVFCAARKRGTQSRRRVVKFVVMSLPPNNDRCHAENASSMTAARLIANGLRQGGHRDVQIIPAPTPSG